jgi:hypothetical protein
LATLLFVHGTGVREEAYDQALGQIRSHTSDWKGLEVKGCFWGEVLGTRLHAGGASVPTFDATRAAGQTAAEGGDPEDDLAILLRTDPLAELQLLALSSVEAGRLPLSARPGEGLRGALNALARDDPAAIPEPVREAAAAAGLADALAAAGLTTAFAAAAGTVAASSACADAAAAAREPLGPFIGALARAAVADATNRVYGPDPATGPGDAARRRAVTALTQSLGGGDYALGGLKEHARALTKSVAAAVGTFGAASYRGRITKGFALAVGDVLYYQSRGRIIRDKVAEMIRQISPPVLLFGHSLGGIACVELLATTKEDAVRDATLLLVTVGSQAPFLYELGALQEMPYPTALPGNFPYWLNFYDLNDFLSYVGMGCELFGPRVDDKQVFSRKSFPESHSHYFENTRDVWEVVRGTWDGLHPGWAKDRNGTVNP